LFFYTLDDLNLLVEGHEIDKKDEWERMRTLAYFSVLPHLKKGANMSPQSLFPLPWDKRENTSTFIERAKEKLKKFMDGKVRN
jgi:hypothetical protein